MVAGDTLAFGWPVAVYLVLSGLGGGTLAFGAVVGLSPGREAVSSARRAVAVALVALSFGAGALVADLERPDRFHLVLSHANPSSVIALGARALSAALLFASASLLELRRRGDGRKSDAWGRGVLLAAAAAGALVAVYPGFVLAQGAATLWKAPALPLLLAVGSLHLGLAAVGAIASEALVRSLRLRAGEVVLACLSLLALGLVAADPRWEGALRGTLWFTLIAGVAAPLALLTGRGRPAVLSRALSLLLAALVLRVAVLFAGQRAWGSIPEVLR